MWIVIVLVILGGGYWYLSRSSSEANEYGTQSSAQTNSTAAGQASAADNGGLPTASTDTSDAAINQDTAAVDAQMNGLNSDNATVDSSLNDQPIPQQ